MHHRRGTIEVIVPKIQRTEISIERWYTALQIVVWCGEYFEIFRPENKQLRALCRRNQGGTGSSNLAVHHLRTSNLESAQSNRARRSCFEVWCH